jgi:hypothetical protein
MRRPSIIRARRKNVLVKFTLRVMGKARVAGHDLQSSAAQKIKVVHRFLRINMVTAAI